MSDDLGWIAVVEDDPIMGESLQRALELEGWRTSWWQTGKETAQRLQSCSPDLVLCDIRLPDMTGEELFRVANSRSLPPPFIFMTAFGQIDQAVSLVRAGACDYLTKPFDLQSLIQKAREIVSLRPRDTAERVLGISPQMRRVEALLRQIAARSLPVLLSGETGSGKEVCARFLHQVSPAASSPFMAVNCAAIPADLLESEVFGHEKGAFSGAHQRHLGYAERARGGTLFLDEIADMPPMLQTKMLRVLEERSFHRVGGESGVPFKARIVCATSENLVEQVRHGRFREDLLYRINAVTVELPPLRKRPEDISWLLSRYFTVFAHQSDGTLRGVSSLAEQAALTHPWRGNVRELRNRIERAVALATGPWLMPADIFPELRDRLVDSVDPMLPLAAVRDAAERRQIEHVLRETKGQIIEAAKRLDISRTTLWEKMRRYGLVAVNQTNNLY
jgi:two-component system, NtrC family, response regulator HydG